MIFFLRAKVEKTPDNLSPVPKLVRWGSWAQILRIAIKPALLSGGVGNSSRRPGKDVGILISRYMAFRQMWQRRGPAMEIKRLSNLLITISVVGGAFSLIYIVIASTNGPSSASTQALSVATAFNSFLILVVAITNGITIWTTRKLADSIDTELEEINQSIKLSEENIEKQIGEVLKHLG